MWDQTNTKRTNQKVNKNTNPDINIGLKPMTCSYFFIIPSNNWCFCPTNPPLSKKTRGTDSVCSAFFKQKSFLH